MLSRLQISLRDMTSISRKMITQLMSVVKIMVETPSTNASSKWSLETGILRLSNLCIHTQFCTNRDPSAIFKRTEMAELLRLGFVHTINSISMTSEPHIYLRHLVFYQTSMSCKQNSSIYVCWRKRTRTSHKQLSNDFFCVDSIHSTTFLISHFNFAVISTSKNQLRQPFQRYIPT